MNAPTQVNHVSAPGMVPEIVELAIPTDDRVWVPQAAGVYFRPLMLNTVTGHWWNLLRVVDEQGRTVGYEDVHTKIDICRAHYEKVGLGASYVDQFIR